MAEPYQCPCCHCYTLSERGIYSICSVCFWEDNGQDDPHADKVSGGPNGLLSLTQARKNYAEFGACEIKFKKNVRAPKSDELPESN
ncbi:MAG: CPCC family cysteine-rich protein [Phycisphaeraceae bacterium]